MPERAAAQQPIAGGNQAQPLEVPPAAAQDAHRLDVVMFGPPAMQRAGEPVQLSRRQTRALLYRLAAQPTPVSRDTLCYLFWPDIPDATARRHLTRLLTYLRRDLPDVVVSYPDSVGLDPERVQSDAVTFERLAATAEPSVLHQAVALYRGPFLSGFSLPDTPEFEGWAFQEQQRFERRYLETLSTLIETHSAQGRYREAIALAERYLETDDLAEEMHRRLIELYVLAGDRAAALRTYERCSALLERELGVAPLPETQAVYQAIVQERFLAASRPAPVVAPAPATLLESPLLGRTEAWQVLEQSLAAARRGRGRVVLLAGEAGIGKSRLMHDFAASQAGQAILLTGAGFTGAQAMPYLPLLDALRPHLRTASLTRLVTPGWLAEASILLPELRMAFPDLPPAAPAATDQARARLFEALRQIVVGLAEPAGPPLLLCLDDLHWADRAMLDWLSYLGYHLAGTRVLLIGAYRSGETDAMGDVRRELRRAGVLVELTLEPLAEPEVLALVRHLAPGHGADQALAGRLHSVTGGNPFYLVEIVRMLHDTGRVDGSVPLPGTVLDTVRARVARLSGEAQQVLAAAAILGDGFAFQVVRETAGRSELETVEALDELVAHALLLEDREENAYRFRHDLIRLVVSQDLGLRRRQILHRRAAQASEASLAGWPRERWPVGRLGGLYAEAGEAASAVPYLLEAAEHARTLYAHDEAIAYYRQALPLCEKLGDQHLAARTLMGLGLTYHDAFDFQKADETYHRGLVAWQRTGSALVSAPARRPLRLPWFHSVFVDPALATETFSWPVAQHLFGSLTELSPALDVVPDLAAAWEVRNGGRTYVVHLRDDARWSDGCPLTAGDFEFAWKRLLSPAIGSVAGPLLHALQGAQAFHSGDARNSGPLGLRSAGDRTLILELEEPVSFFPQLLTQTYACPVPRHVLEQHGEAWTDPQHLVSCGPFRLAAARSDGFLELVRDRGYHGRFTGNLQRIELHGDLEPGRVIEAYEAGQIDVLFLNQLRSWDAASWVRQSHAGEYFSAPLLAAILLRLNPLRSPLQDVRVRQALTLALDRDVLANRIQHGFRSPATGGFVPPGMPGHMPGIGLPHDPDRARHLMDVAGYPSGRGFPTLEAWHDGGDSVSIEWLQAQWRDILGVEVAWRLVDWRNRFDIGPAGPHLVYSSWLAAYPDPDYYLRVGLLAWGLLPEEGELAGLVARAGLATSQAGRMALYGQADRELMAGATLVPLLYGRLHLLIKPWVKAYPVSPMSWCFWKDVIIESH